MRILLAILLLPLIDIASFAVIGPKLGVPGTLLSVLFSIVLGTAILRRSGLRAIEHLRRTVVEGQQAMPETIDAALLALSGILFILPGFVSDILAVLLLVPPVRDLAARQILRYFATHSQVFVVRPKANPEPAARTITDVDFDEIEPPGR